MDKKKAYGIMAFAVACCVVMAFVETVIEPAYLVKSAIKAVVFLALPLVLARAAGIRLWDGAFGLDRKSVVSLLTLGLVIYGGIIGAYALTQNLFDYGSLVQALSADQKVGNGSFWGVAFYISFCNSFLEEFFFRLVAFLLGSLCPLPRGDDRDLLPASAAGAVFDGAGGRGAHL